MSLKSKLEGKMLDYVNSVLLPITYQLQKDSKIDDYQIYLNVVLEKLRESREVSNNA